MQAEIQEDIIYCLDKDERGMFLTKEEHDESNNDICNEETEKQSEYQKDYQHAIFEMKKQYNLRNRNVVMRNCDLRINQIP